MSLPTYNWYEVSDIDALDSPALIIFPARVKQNIATAINMAGDVARLRPHIKTHKSPDVVKLMMEAGITKFKCATIAEAEILGQCGASDVLLAYQVTGPKLNRFIALIKKYPATKFACLADSMETVTEQANAFSANELSVPVYIDLNIGMNRTGIAPGTAAIDLYKQAASLGGIIMAGLHAYDGQLRNPDIGERTKECNEGFSPVEEMRDELLRQGFNVPVVIAGGSPSFPVHASRPGVECSPGTFIYWDQGYLNICPEQNFIPAAVLVTRVISLPSKNKITTDLGHKSVSAENEITRRIQFLNATNLIPAGQSEEHLVLEVTDQHAYKIGDVLYGIPFHVCPTIALYERGITVEEGMITGEFRQSARDRKISV